MPEHVVVVVDDILHLLVLCIVNRQVHRMCTKFPSSIILILHYSTYVTFSALILKLQFHGYGGLPSHVTWLEITIAPPILV